MRKALFALIVLLVFLSPSFAETSPFENMTGSPKPTKFDGGVLTGFVIDVGGYALFLSGGLLTSVDLGLGLTLYNVGGAASVIGGSVWTLFLSQKHDAYVKGKAADITGLKDLSWTLVWCSLGCAVGSAGLQIFTDGVGDIIGIVLAGAAVIIEVCNAWLVRVEWNPKINTKVAALDEGPEIRPVVTAYQDPVSKDVIGYLGVSIAY